MAKKKEENKTQQEIIKTVEQTVDEQLQTTEETNEQQSSQEATIENDNIEEEAVDFGGRAIVVRNYEPEAVKAEIEGEEPTDKPAEPEAHIIINKDGSKEEGNAEDKGPIIVCLIGGKDIGWTHLYALRDVIKWLQERNAGAVQRWDAYHKKEVNPVFNLQHVLIKFGLR